ncbi:glycosyltransferase involved in cell wall biosynthesis [Novosphingobium chloroacetimidivorans]|uniref:Glycosyltransferase involved in cell wall biosynthesis n=1 Tax=Novosphingobium chloroacetimidivorans TaxID=1428314 RepID=A0A7W7KBE9_9SPHN|nr:glycosyltransferase [Novosphingobium chloroacetimidivorans]MBB4859691.1 glycosyltransferase involved in cell wall biosynthesis [Novosphingobium chloroacetimidivorans]
MRILSIATLFPNPVRPGFGIFVGNQMRAVVARGDVDLTVVSPIGMPPWPLSTREPYARLRSIPADSRAVGLPVLYPRFTLIPKIGGDGNPARIARAVLPLVRRLHAEHPFDLVDAQFFFPDGPAAAIVARELGLPLTIKSRGADIHYWAGRPKARAQILAAAEQAAGLLAVSKALREDMIALGMTGDRILVHYTGLDRERFRPMARTEARAQVAAMEGIRVPEDGPLLVTTGALIARKGQRLVIEALDQLPGARLALAGAGEDEAALRSLVRERGLADRVHFLGQVGHEALPPLLSAADVLVLPSASEGLANAWVEALACGTPIVVPDIGGAREVVQDRSAGRIVARDSAAIAAGVREILAAPPSQAEVAAHADRFSWDANADNLVRFWSGVLAAEPIR